jgi:hypothetical protein
MNEMLTTNGEQSRRSSLAHDIDGHTLVLAHLAPLTSRASLSAALVKLETGKWSLCRNVQDGTSAPNLQARGVLTRVNLAVTSAKMGPSDTWKPSYDHA